MKLKKLIILVFSLIITLSSVSAASLGSIEGPFKMLFDMLHNQWLVYGLTFLFYFMLFYGIYASALKFVPVFKSGDGISHQGKVVALALSGLSLLSIFYYTDKQPQRLLETLLDPFGVFGGLVLAALFAAIVYFGIRGADNESNAFAWAAFAAGLGMVVTGLIMTWDSILSYGFIIMFIAMLVGLANYGWHNWRGGHEGAPHEHGPAVPHIPPAPPIPPTPPPHEYGPHINHINGGRDIDFTGHDINNIIVDGTLLDTVTGGRITDPTGVNTLADFANIDYHPQNPTTATITIPSAIHANPLYYRLYLRNGHDETYNFFRLIQTRPVGDSPTITSINGDLQIDNEHGDVTVTIIGTHLDTVDRTSGGHIRDEGGNIVLDSTNFSRVNYNHSGQTQAQITVSSSLAPGFYWLTLINTHGQSNEKEFEIRHSPSDAPMISHLNGQVNNNGIHSPTQNPILISQSTQTLMIRGDNLRAASQGGIFDPHNPTTPISDLSALSYNAADDNNATINVPAGLRIGMTYVLVLRNDRRHGDIALFILTNSTTPPIKDVPTINRINPDIIDNSKDIIIMLEGDNLNIAMPISGYIINAKTKTALIIPSDFGKLKYFAISRTEANITIPKKFKDGIFRISLSNKNGQGNEKEFTIKKGTSGEPEFSLATGKAVTFLDMPPMEIEIVENCQNLSINNQISHKITEPNLGTKFKEATLHALHPGYKVFTASLLLNSKESDSGSLIITSELDNGSKTIHKEIILAFLEERADTISKNMKFSSITRIDPKIFKSHEGLISMYNEKHEISNIVDFMIRQANAKNDASIISTLEILNNIVKNNTELNDLVKTLKKNPELSTIQLKEAAKSMEDRLKAAVERINKQNPERIEDIDKSLVDRMIIVHEALVFIAKYALRNIKPTQKLLPEPQKKIEDNKDRYETNLKHHLINVHELEKEVKELKKLHPEGSIYWDRELKLKELVKVEEILSKIIMTGIISEQSIEYIHNALENVKIKRELIESSKGTSLDGKIYHESMNDLLKLIEDNILTNLKKDIDANLKGSIRVFVKNKNAKEIYKALFQEESARLGIIKESFKEILQADNELKDRVEHIQTELNNGLATYIEIEKRYAGRDPEKMMKEISEITKKTINTDLIIQNYEYIHNAIKSYSKTSSAYYEYYKESVEKYKEELVHNNVPEKPRNQNIPAII